MDPARAFADLLASALEATGEYEPVVGHGVEPVLRHLHDAPPGEQAGLVLVDLSFGCRHRNGLDVILAYRRVRPDARLVIYTLGTPADWPLLEVAWAAAQPLSVVSKATSVVGLLHELRSIARGSEARVPAEWRSPLRAVASPWRTVHGFEALVPHAGHAKLWQALLVADRSPSYDEVARCSGLAANTIRNYRADLLGPLRLHGLDNPGLHAMFDFAQLTRPLLAPIVADRLQESAPVASGPASCSCAGLVGSLTGSGW